ncbi:hypothetical protein ACFTUC_41625 [Streptomyces sp. NPDC056944]|uniref:hypothetical protein n=1 Tax=Streptomyces sp. NPDC056944 TaxID=3345972 RepID=UPI00363E00E9
MTHTQLELALADALKMIGTGPHANETPTEFAARLIESVGARAYSLVIARIQSGRYPAPDTPEWDAWAPNQIAQLRDGTIPTGAVTYGCGHPLSEGFATCGFQRGHNGPHGKNY